MPKCPKCRKDFQTSLPYLVLYHGTPADNVPAILKHGIRPRNQFSKDEDLIDSILSKYNLTRNDVPKDWIEVAKLFYSGESKYHTHDDERKGDRVHLSGSKSYAVCNALAGFEVQDDLEYRICKKFGFKYEMPKRRKYVVFEVRLPIDFYVNNDPHGCMHLDAYERFRDKDSDLFNQEEYDNTFQEVRVYNTIPPKYIKGYAVEASYDWSHDGKDWVWVRRKKAEEIEEELSKMRKKH